MRHCAYLLSQYAWILIYGVFVLIPFFIPYRASGGPFRSETREWSAATKPGLFVHLTDIHVNHKVVEHNALFEKALSIVQRNLSMPFIALTGDIADNFPKEKMPRYGTPQKEDMEIYMRMLSEWGVESIAENAGNHDLFGVLSFTSEASYFAKHREWTEDELKVSVVNRTIGGERVFFIVANPFEYPTPHPPLLYWVKTSEKFLNLMEDAFEEIGDDSAHVIVLCHYPYDMFKYEGKSRAGRSFKDMIKSGRVTLSLNGHMHPEQPVFLHHGDGMEVIGTDLMTHHRFGVVTMDNGRIAYHNVDVNDPELVFVTSPVDRTHLGPHQVFNEPGALRIMAFTSEEPKFTATVDGVDVQVQCEKEESYYLCSGDISQVGSGVHSLVLSGSAARSFEFLVANESDAFTESVYSEAYVEHYAPVLGVVMFFILLLVVPFHISRNYEQKYWSWLMEDDITNVSHWWLTVLGGFFAIKMRLNRLPLFDRISLVVGGLLPLFCPMIITVVEGHVGGVWLYGHVCAGKNYFYEWGLILTLVYSSAVFLPIVTLFSGLAVGQHWTLLIDLIPPLASIGYNFVTTLRFCNESAGLGLSVLSPGFVLVPLFFYVNAIILFFQRRKKQSLIPSVALLGEHHDA